VPTRLPRIVTGNRPRMTTQAPSGDPVVPAAFAFRPPMPSIAASALLETQLLIDRTRRAVAAWLTRTDWTA
jgi:hypothetical protein